MRRNTLSVLSCVAAAGVFVFLGACQSGQKTAETHASASAGAKPVNAMCPVGGHAVSAKVATVSYKNQAVGFCCADCAQEWGNMSDQEKDKALASAMTTKP